MKHMKALKEKITSILFGRHCNKEILLLTSLALSVTEAAVRMCSNVSKTTTLLRYHKDSS